MDDRFRTGKNHSVETETPIPVELVVQSFSIFFGTSWNTSSCRDRGTDSKIHVLFVRRKYETGGDKTRDNFVGAVTDD